MGEGKKSLGTASRETRGHELPDPLLGFRPHPSAVAQTGDKLAVVDCALAKVGFAHAGFREEAFDVCEKLCHADYCIRYRGQVKCNRKRTCQNPPGSVRKGHD